MSQDISQHFFFFFFLAICVSRVMCHVSHVTWHMSQSGKAYGWRVCYTRGLPRLVLIFVVDLLWKSLCLISFENTLITTDLGICINLSLNRIGRTGGSQRAGIWPALNKQYEWECNYSFHTQVLATKIGPCSQFRKWRDILLISFYQLVVMYIYIYIYILKKNIYWLHNLCML